MSMTDDKRGAGRPKFGPRDHANKFLLSLDEITPAEEMIINRTLNGNHGITLADLRRYVAAFIRST